MADETPPPPPPAYPGWRYHPKSGLVVWVSTQAQGEALGPEWQAAPPSVQPPPPLRDVPDWMFDDEQNVETTH